MVEIEKDETFIYSLILSFMSRNSTVSGASCHLEFLSLRTVVHEREAIRCATAEEEWVHLLRQLDQHATSTYIVPSLQRIEMNRIISSGSTVVHDGGKDRQRSRYSRNIKVAWKCIKREFNFKNCVVS